MANDFKLSHAWSVLLRAGWTEQDLDLFTSGDMPKQVLHFIRQDEKLIKKLQGELSLTLHGEKLIDDVFTPELTEELGFSKRLRNGVLVVLRSHTHGQENDPREDYPPFRTIAELAKLSQKQLARIPRLKDEGVSYIIAVLKSLGINVPER